MKEYFSSIRFRLWIIFVIFSLATMGVLFISRAVLTPVFYGRYKRSECISVANTIEKLVTSGTWNEYDIMDVEYLNTIVKDMAITHQFDIIVNLPLSKRNVYNYKSGESGILTQSVSSDIKSALINDDDGTIIKDVDLNNSQGIIFAKCVKRNVENTIYIPAYIFIFS